MSDIKIPLTLLSHTDLKLESIDVESSTVISPIKPVSPAEPKLEPVVLPNSPKPFVKGHSGTDAWSQLARRPTAKAKTAAILDSAQPRAATITVLQALNRPTRKEFRLNAEGELDAPKIGMDWAFNWRREPVNDIRDLSRLITKLSKESNRMLIRGEPQHDLFQKIDRSKANFPEPPEGRPWLMLDFDGVALPDGMSTVECASIEYLIRKLPGVFHDSSYFFQFSASAGVLKADGNPRKSGISVHLFYWLSRPVHGGDIGAWLRLHCLETGWFERGFTSNARAKITYGIDGSVFGDVQPHYVALPLIGDGVACTLVEGNRQGLVEKASMSVNVPNFADSMRSSAKFGSDHILNAWKMENCEHLKTSAVRTSLGRISVKPYYAMGNVRQPGLDRFIDAVKTDKTFADGVTISIATLHFDGEASKGSWYVTSRSPQMAVHHGDYSSVPLQELSEKAYAYIRDTLRWFTEIVYRDLPLMPDGYLPPFESFVQSRTTVILAPTGSGKTYALCQYALSKYRTKIIIYAAQTIALTHQVAQDLRNAGVLVHHYQGFRGWYQPMMPGVYVTTNVSLKRFIEHVSKQGTGFILVVDEVHAALDDFMRSEQKSRLFDGAMRRASQTILMTGTLTPLQMEKIGLCVEEATGALTNKNFQFCAFQPVRRNPLFLAKESDFGADLVALIRSHRALKDGGQPIPRTVVIVPTSKIRVYQMLLQHFGLLNDAMVVSRREVTQADIEMARTSKLPWLISSPLFAVGLNFEHAPVRFWTSFKGLQVDTSAIIQTVNRANRSDVACEVRLYAGALDPEPAPYMDPETERADIHAFLLEETAAPGVIDPVHLLDRATYLALRRTQDQRTAKAMFQLKNNDAIQNYTIIEDWPDNLSHDPGDAELYKHVRTAANTSYDGDVASRYTQYAQEDVEDIDLLLGQLEQELERRGNMHTGDAIVPKIFDDEILGILAAISGNPKHATRSGGADPRTILRLHGVSLPFYSGQVREEKADEWRPILKEKVQSIIDIVYAIEGLKSGKLNGISFGKKMRQKGLFAGLKALAPSEKEFIGLKDLKAKLDKLHTDSIKSSERQRKEIDHEFFELARHFLDRVGVVFEKTTGVNGKACLDPTKPIVPAWDYAGMVLDLELLTESVANRDVMKPNRAQAAHDWFGNQFSVELCRSCAHCSIKGECALGRPVQYFLDDFEPVLNECEHFKPLSVRVQRLKFAGK